jgi:PhoH-like ATPase
MVDRAQRKLFVLDTNVLMHDPMSLYRFDEHDIFLPMITLEELDANKKGTSENARNARQASRNLDDIVSSNGDDVKEGISLKGPSKGLATGNLYLQMAAHDDVSLPKEMPFSVKDNQILGVVMSLKKKEEESGQLRKVVLVSNDINMRIKARALGLEVQVYRNDRVLEDTDLLYTGMRELPKNFWHTHGKDVTSFVKDGYTFYDGIYGNICAELHVNGMVSLDVDDPKKAFEARVVELHGKRAKLRILTDYRHEKHAVWDITARNAEQNFALNLLMDPEVDFVTLLGQAGTGKTLLTLAAALVQTLETNQYSEIFVTRVTVPVGEDIGFLPGTEEEKMAPWMGAFQDNLDVLNRVPEPGHKDDGPYGKHNPGNDWGKAATSDLIRSRIKFRSLSFVRGRSFYNKFVIVDEAQNLTPKQMKTLITRVGPGTKMVCLGNIAQIDTPYLTEGSSGLTYVVEHFKGWPHGGHITLKEGVRSRLATFASETL